MERNLKHEPSAERSVSIAGFFIQWSPVRKEALVECKDSQRDYQ
jgi:hypothetical protein